MAQTVSDNKSYIIMNYASRTVLDLRFGSNANGTQVQCWGFTNGNSNVVWKLEKYDNRYFFVRNANSGTYLDLAFGNNNNGTKVQGWAWRKHNRHQLWEFVAAPRGRDMVQLWYIRNKGTGTYVDLAFGNKANGTPVQGWNGAGANSAWIMLETTN